MLGKRLAQPYRRLRLACATNLAAFVIAMPLALHDVPQLRSAHGSNCGVVDRHLVCALRQRLLSVGWYAGLPHAETWLAGLATAAMPVAALATSVLYLRERLISPTAPAIDDAARPTFPAVRGSAAPRSGVLPKALAVVPEGRARDQNLRVGLASPNQASPARRRQT